MGEDTKGLLSVEAENNNADYLIDEGGGVVYLSARHSEKRIPTIFYVYVGLFMVVLGLIVVAIITTLYPVMDDDYCFRRATYYSKEFTLYIPNTKAIVCYPSSQRLFLRDMSTQ